MRAGWKQQANEKGEHGARLRTRAASARRFYCGGLIGVPSSFTFLLTFLASGDFLSSVFFASGVVPGLIGETVGDATGEASGLAVAAGVGVVAGLFGTTGFGSQAPNTAVETAKTVDNINDLLIVFLLTDIHANPKPVRWQTSAAGMKESGSFLVRVKSDKNFTACHRSISTLRARERAGGGNLQEFFGRKIGTRICTEKSGSTRI